METKENKLVTWINQEIEDRDWSYRELGRRAQMSHSQVSKVLNGEQLNITWEFCNHMSKAFNRSVWEFAIMAGIVADVPDEVKENEETGQLVGLFKKLPPEDKREVINFTKWLTYKREQDM